MKPHELLTERFGKNVSGVLNCFDRLALFGTYRPICCPKAMEWEIQGVLGTHLKGVLPKSNCRRKGLRLLHEIGRFP